MNLRNRGMTLMEVMFAMGIFTIVIGALFTLGLAFADTARVQDVRATSNDEARRAIQTIAPRLRSAQGASINWNDLPGDVLTFQMPTDLNGNGTAVSATGGIELGTPITIQIDVDDLNEDGVTTTQLVMIQDGEVRVIANNVVPDAGQGFWAQPRDGGLEISIETFGETRQGHQLITRLREFVVPRN